MSMTYKSGKMNESNVPFTSKVHDCTHHLETGRHKGTEVAVPLPLHYGSVPAMQYHEVHAHCTGDCLQSLWLLNLFLILIHCRNILMKVYWGQSVTKYVPFKETTLTMYRNCYPHGYKAAH